MPPPQRPQPSGPPNKPGQYQDPRRPPGSRQPGTDEHEGATEQDVGDRGGPGVGYDQEPEQERDKGGVAES